MKSSSSFTIRPLSILALAVAACATLGFAPVNASAQTPTVTRTIHGKFKHSDGNKGTYTTTVTKTATGETEDTVLTRSSDNATSTTTSVTTDNTDGTRTVVYTHNDFGATAQFTSTKVVTGEMHSDAYGHGTYTDATGVSGVFSTLESKIEKIVAINAEYTTSTGTTRELHLTDSELGFTAEKIVTLNPDGTVSSVLQTRFITIDKK